MTEGLMTEDDTETMAETYRICRKMQHPQHVASLSLQSDEVITEQP